MKVIKPTSNEDDTSKEAIQISETWLVEAIIELIINRDQQASMKV